MANGMSNATIRDIVLVLSWRRAGYLRQCLNSLLHSRGINEKEVWVFQNDREDKGIDLSDVHSVIREFSELFPRFSQLMRHIQMEC